MTRIVDLDTLVPEDIEFKYRGETYVLPGDIEMEQSLRLAALFERAAAAQEGTTEERARADKDIVSALTDLFRVRHPDLEQLPFGTIAMQHVLGEVLAALGMQIIADETVPPKPKPVKQAVPRSRRSTGSRK